MKLMIKNIRFYQKSLLIAFAFISTCSILFGQGMPEINARFANPLFDSHTKMYYVDVELSSKATNEYLFGMNVRFFYDATMLDFQNFDQFNVAYGTLGAVPSTQQGTSEAGSQLFNLKEATVFVNGAVQLTDVNNPLLIEPDKWVKVFRVCFKVPLINTVKRDFCPSIIWDTRGDDGRGGYLTGDDGLVITVLEKDPNTPEDSAPSHVSGTFFNWEKNSIPEMPYGKPVPSICVTLEQTTSTQDHDINGKGFALFQNEPNPFNHGTAIQFIIPAAQEVNLKFYDVSGKQIHEIKGQYKEGLNVINLDRLPWMDGSKVIVYQMMTEGFRSNTMKMVLITE